MSKTKDHAHKLKRHTYKNKSKVYHCVLPDCYFKIEPALAEGKRLVCNRCGNEFIANQYTTTLAKPHCEDCHKFKHEVVKRRYKGRRNDDVVIPDSAAIMNPVAETVIDNLKDRLNGLSTEPKATSMNIPVSHVTMNLEEEDL